MHQALQQLFELFFHGEPKVDIVNAACFSNNEPLLKVARETLFPTDQDFFDQSF